MRRARTVSLLAACAASFGVARAIVACGGDDASTPPAVDAGTPDVAHPTIDGAFPFDAALPIEGGGSADAQTDAEADADASAAADADAEADADAAD